MVSLLLRIERESQGRVRVCRNVGDIERCLADGVLAPSATPYTCPWKGPAQYWDLRTAGGTISDGAWSYPDLIPSAVERVGRDFAGYVAFDRRSVTVSE